MTSDFYLLIESGNPKDLDQAYDLLLLDERHLEVADLTLSARESSLADIPSDIDWDHLERLALTPTPIDRVELFLGGTRKLVSFPVAVAGFLGVLSGLTITAVWVQNQIYSDTSSIFHLFFVGLVVLSLLSFTTVLITLLITGLTLRYFHHIGITGRLKPSTWRFLQSAVIPAMACTLVVSGAFVGGQTSLALSPLFTGNAIRLFANSNTARTRTTAFTAGLTSWIKDDPGLLSLVSNVSASNADGNEKLLSHRLLAEPTFRDKLFLHLRTERPQTYSLIQDALAKRSEQSEIGTALNTMAVDGYGTDIKITDEQHALIPMEDVHWKQVFSSFVLVASDYVDLVSPTDTSRNKSASPPHESDRLGSLPDHCAVIVDTAPVLACGITDAKRSAKLEATADLEKLRRFIRAVKVAEADREAALNKIVAAADRDELKRVSYER